MIVRGKRPTCFDWCRYADRCAEDLGLPIAKDDSG
jgi:hypothetical protein